MKTKLLISTMVLAFALSTPALAGHQLSGPDSGTPSPSALPHTNFDGGASGGGGILSINSGVNGADVC